MAEGRERGERGGGRNQGEMRQRRRKGSNENFQIMTCMSHVGSVWSSIEIFQIHRTWLSEISFQ